MPELYQRADVNANVTVSNVLSGETNSTNVAALFHSDDETVVNTCVEYEKSLYSNRFKQHAAW